MVEINMSQAVKAPPRKSGTRSAPKAAVKVDARTNVERRSEGLKDLGQLGQGGLLMARQWADAATVGKYWPPVADELAKLADQYEYIAKPVDVLIQVGPFSALVLAAMPLVLQLMTNHGALDPAGLAGYGIVPPQVLEAQMKAEVARMQAEAFREQQAALREAEIAQREYEAFVAEQQRMMAEEAGENVTAAIQT